MVTRFQPRQERVVVAVYIIGIYMTVVDSTIVYTALPSIARDFHAALPSTEWVSRLPAEPGGHGPLLGLDR